MSLLKIIDNPTDDISLVTVLRSMIGGFCDNELLKIRIGNTSKSFYGSMCDYLEKETEDIELKEKVKNFLEKIESFRNRQEYMPLNEFLWMIYLETGYYNYASLMPNGILRASNLKMLFERAKQYEKTSFKGLYNFISFIDKLRLSSGDMSSAKLIGENEDVIRIMSIHKSKGLEFPVVFLCGMAKQFNMTDLNKAPMLLHQDLGLGPKYINYEEGEAYTTLAREAIRVKSKLELISEEMRVLYVALTRAKEKLFITGLEKDYAKSIEKKELIVSSYKELGASGKINRSIIQKHMSFLSWIEFVYLARKKELDGGLKLESHSKQEVLKLVADKEEEHKLDLDEYLSKVDKNEMQDIKNKLEWEYSHKKIPGNILTKSSVSKIKDMKLNLDEYNEAEYNVPEFLKEEKELTGAEKGTLMHLLLQKLDERLDYDYDRLNEFIMDLEKKGIISEKERNCVDIQKILLFTQSDIWKELKTAKEVYKERPFYINVPISDVYDEAFDDDILVQGIIDLYYINKNDEIVLVDYKTDKVKNLSELKNKYSEQLLLYKGALERALGRKVAHVYIYSVYWGETIII